MSYHNITIDDMKKVLSRKGWEMKIVNGINEYVFDFPLSQSPNIIVRVMSGINFNGNSRECGQDAIRVFAVDIKNHKGYIRTKRVYRIETWEKNLKKAVLNCFNNAKKRRNNC